MTNSNQYGISEEQLRDLNTWNAESFTLESIQLRPSGHGHYDLVATMTVNGKSHIHTSSTTNMQLVDAWKSGMQDIYEDGEDGFDDWDEVIETMLSSTMIEKFLEELEY